MRYFFENAFALHIGQSIYIYIYIYFILYEAQTHFQKNNAFLNIYILMVDI